MRFTILLLFILVCFRASAQDNIFLRDGTIITGKVIEINSKEIRYKTTDNLGGPVYVVGKLRIIKIRYENGKEELVDYKSDTKKRFAEEEIAYNVFYLEVVGNCINGVSLNFDHTFYRNSSIGITGRLGISPRSFNNGLVGIPVTLSLLRGQKANIELGAGITVAIFDEYDPWNYNYVKRNAAHIFPTAIVGFRYQAKDKLFVKMVFTPIYITNVNDNSYAENPIPLRSPGIYNTLGVSLGYAF